MRQWLGMIALLAAVPAIAQPVLPPTPDSPPPRGDTPPVDYRDPKSWMCRPGVDDGTCSANLDAVTVDGQGQRTPAPYVAAKDPPIDCFFVYPTTSLDPTIYSDMIPDAQEKRTVHGQAARLGSVCRLYVPIYHQFTATALRWGMRHEGKAEDIGFDPPYRDVLAAWRSYLERDNHGRGVVLVGHSQGAILLKRLIAAEIDGKPAQKRLVAAYLAGNIDLGAGSFAKIPPCAAIAQTGCLVAWSSYREEAKGNRLFGHPAAGQAPLCVNPAAPGGGRALLKPYLPRPRLAPETDPPFVEPVGQLSAECVADEQGAVLRIRIEPGKYADIMDYALTAAGNVGHGWGVHPLDISLVQGNMIDMIQAQSAAWEAKRK